MWIFANFSTVSTKSPQYASSIDLFRNAKIAGYRYYMVVPRKSGYDSPLFRRGTTSIPGEYNKADRRGLYALQDETSRINGSRMVLARL